MSSIAYRDGLGNTRYRDTYSGAGTELSPDVMTSHDPVLGETSDSAAASPGSTASAIALLKGLWSDWQTSDTTASATLLNAVTATGAGSSTTATRYGSFAFYFTATSVTSGGTVAIEVEAPDGTWHEIHREVIAANTATTAIAPFTISAPFRAVRGNVVSRTDGTFTLGMTAR
jgi:hypothetical protein